MRIGTQQQVACVQMQHRHLISCLVASLRGIASRIAALRLRVGSGREKGVGPARSGANKLDLAVQCYYVGRLYKCTTVPIDGARGIATRGTA